MLRKNYKHKSNDVWSPGNNHTCMQNNFNVDFINSVIIKKRKPNFQMWMKSFQKEYCPITIKQQYMNANFTALLIWK